MNLVTYVLAFAGFIYGLALGRKVNDKMEAVTISRQPISRAAQGGGGGGGLETALDYQSFPLDDEGAPTNIGQRPMGGDVIKMDVITDHRNYRQ